MSILQKLRAWLGFSEQREAAPPPGHPAPQATAEKRPTPVGVIALEQAYAAYQDGARFIDVREPDEWANGHIAGAVHHPVGGLEQQAEITVTRDTPVVTYCAAGARAARAASALAANGYTDVQALQSGYADWAAAGYPVERPDHDAAP